MDRERDRGGRNSLSMPEEKEKRKAKRERERERERKRVRYQQNDIKEKTKKISKYSSFLIVVFSNVVAILSYVDNDSLDRKYCLLLDLKM